MENLIARLTLPTRCRIASINIMLPKINMQMNVVGALLFIFSLEDINWHKVNNNSLP